MHSNVTGTLTTCEPWGLTIVGGTKPYTVVLAALDSPITTNVTMAAPDDVFTYPNRADPGGQIMGEPPPAQRPHSTADAARAPPASVADA